MSLATLNNNYLIPIKTFQQSRTDYKFAVTNKVNAYLGAWMKSRPYISLMNKAQKISDADMKALSDMVQADNDKWVRLQANLNSMMLPYFKNNISAMANAIPSDKRFQWQGYTMLQLLTESQIIADACAQINTALAGKTSYKIG